MDFVRADFEDTVLLRFVPPDTTFPPETLGECTTLPALGLFRFSGDGHAGKEPSPGLAVSLMSSGDVI